MDWSWPNRETKHVSQWTLWRPALAWITNQEKKSLQIGNSVFFARWCAPPVDRKFSSLEMNTFIGNSARKPSRLKVGDTYFCLSFFVLNRHAVFCQQIVLKCQKVHRFRCFFSAASCKKRHRKRCTWIFFWSFLFLWRLYQIRLKFDTRL